MFRLCSLLLLLATPVSAEVPTLTGIVRVVDGDTIELSSPDNIRLVGLDAPEGDQTCRDPAGTELPCGRLATAFVRDAYDGRRATCRVEGYDGTRSRRPLAVCFVDGRDINAELVRLGIARVYRRGMRYEDLRYLEEQKEAELLGRGLWAYVMSDPALHRATGRAGIPSAGPPNESCTIKGNIGSARIYHLPGMRDYDATIIRERDGERWFCSEA
ncbi:MAG: thermonuclease family protein, partial [Jannaschia sp.]